VRQAQPVLLEPIMSMEVLTPAEYMGEVLNDLSSRRGHITSMAGRETVQSIQALVPLAELFGYSTAVRSLTRGRASYTMEPARFDMVPDSLQQQLINR
jgi:elongation factor G